MARRWSPGWRMTGFVAVMLPLVVSLGCWQLERGALKRGYEARYFERMAEPARAMPAEFGDREFQRVALSGSFDAERYFLVDNQIHQGRPGYWVIAPFVADDGRTWLVNRGWVAAPRLRAELPDVSIPTGTLTIRGVLWPDTGLVPLLAEDAWGDAWPKRIQRLDLQRIAGSLGGVLPVEIRLEGGQTAAFEAASLGHDFKARMHDGYAAQWFGLGAVLIVGYIIFGFRRHD